ncbi:MAG TPA: MBL fold metallo-hydrolase [Dermatophilaceae bacterium]|nr:MBL fold metallo-hydrolase [Dermatophilaceae bacterium]
MEIVSGIHLIPSKMVNCYVILEPDGITLIDAGMSKANVVKYLKGLGRPLTDLNRIIITHSDPDHVSALADLVTASGARVFAHRLEAQAITDGRASRPLNSRWAALVLKVFLSVFKQKPARVDQLLDDGEELPIAGGLRVVATPGHTPGHISLYAPASRVLFCGDSMEAGRDGRLRRSPTTRTWGEQEAMESVKTQQALGARIICAGHGPVVRPAADKFPIR